MKYRPVRLSRHKNHLNPRKERGAVAILVALSMVVLVGMVGLAIDSGKLFIAKSELQNSADACALAAARELFGTNSNQLVLAETAGIRAGTANNVLFQSAPVALNVDDSVQFSLTLGGSYQTKSALSPAEALTMKYARCTTERTGIANWLIPILNMLPGASIAATQDVRSMAVATLAPSQTFSCPLPMRICSSNLPAAPGIWIASNLTKDCGGSNSAWVTYGTKTGVPAVRAGLTDQCSDTDLPAIGANVAVEGCKTTLIDAWNTRFGLYVPSITIPSPGDVVNMPDNTGFAYYPGWGGMSNPPPLAPNKFADYLNKNGAFTPLQTPTATEIDLSKEPPAGPGSKGFDPKGGTGTSLTSIQHQNLGSNRRVAIVAVVDCPGGATVQKWACVLMVHPLQNNMPSWVEYLGDANAAGSPCATFGVPGGPTGSGPLVPTLVR